ncbi:MAG: hypothetical protein ACRYGP_09240 [Janthinobacterium lividum]
MAPTIVTGRTDLDNARTWMGLTSTVHHDLYRERDQHRVISNIVSGGAASAVLRSACSQGVAMPWIDKASLIVAVVTALGFAVTLIGAACAIVGKAMVHQMLVG